MKIQLKQPLNVAGEEREAGETLVVGSDIPKWQAEKALALRVAEKISGKSQGKSGK